MRQPAGAENGGVLSGVGWIWAIQCVRVRRVVSAVPTTLFCTVLPRNYHCIGEVIRYRIWDDFTKKRLKQPRLYKHSGTNGQAPHF